MRDFAAGERSEGSPAAAKGDALFGLTVRNTDIKMSRYQDIRTARLKCGESSRPAYAKLADRSVCRSGACGPADTEESPIVADYGDSGFLHAVYGRSPGGAVMDDLTDIFYTVDPRVYEDGIIKKASECAVPLTRY